MNRSKIVEHKFEGNQWERKLNDMEWRLLFVVYREFAYCCDFFMMRVIRQNKEKRYRDTQLP